MPTVVAEAAAGRLHALMQLAFEQALRKCADRVHESSYSFGGYPVQIRVVGHEMAGQITRCFSHLKIDASDCKAPQLTIDLWDESETNIRCQKNISSNGDTRSAKMTAISPDGRLVWQRLKNVHTSYNHCARHIISSAVWRGHLSVYERWKPLARPLLEWHNDRSVQIIHASLVVRHGQGVLFAGKSGSGKSTSALTCFCAGFHFLGEDYVGLQQLDNGSFIGHSLYNSVFLDPRHLTRFPAISPYAIKGLTDHEKSTVLLSQVCSDRLARHAPITVLVLPRIVASTRPKFYRASRGDALLALGPTSLLQIPSRRLGAFGFYKIAQLIERVPCYWLEINSDLASIPGRVQEILLAARAL